MNKQTKTLTIMDTLTCLKNNKHDSVRILLTTEVETVQIKHKLTTDYSLLLY